MTFKWVKKFGFQMAILTSLMFASVSQAVTLQQVARIGIYLVNNLGASLVDKGIDARYGFVFKKYDDSEKSKILEDALYNVLQAFRHGIPLTAIQQDMILELQNK